MDNISLTSDIFVSSVVLEGAGVRLEPSHSSHDDDLREALQSGSLDNLWFTTVPTPSGLTKERQRRETLAELGQMVSFVVIDKACNIAIGMTTYMNIDHVNRRLEIGSTWYRSSSQRTGINTETKFLLLRHAFEDCQAIAVEFRTHALNVRSRRAIERLGAKFDGLLRQHMIMKNGTLRDTAVYSICDHEWPTIKAHLQWLLDRYHHD